MTKLKPRNFRMYVIRFIGTAFVFSYHYDVENGIYGLPHLITPTSYHNLNLGGIGVILFFLLSGESVRKLKSHF